MENKGYTTGENFKKLRERVGLTQMELAIVLNIKRSLVGAYEEGRANVQNAVISSLIDKGFLNRSDLYDFMFDKDFIPHPTKHYRKLMFEVLANNY